MFSKVALRNPEKRIRTIGFVVLATAIGLSWCLVLENTSPSVSSVKRIFEEITRRSDDPRAHSAICSLLHSNGCSSLMTSMVPGCARSARISPLKSSSSRATTP